MKSIQEYREDYREEKSIVIGTEDKRTGLETFPSFEEWFQEVKDDFLVSYEITSNVEVDYLVEQTKAELNPEENKISSNLKLRRHPMTESTVTNTSRPDTDVPTTATSVTKANTPSKADLARKIFAVDYPRVVSGEIQRKDVIIQFMNDAKMAKAYASTFYQTMRTAYNVTANTVTT